MPKLPRTEKSQPDDREPRSSDNTDTVSRTHREGVLLTFLANLFALCPFAGAQFKRESDEPWGHALIAIIELGSTVVVWVSFAFGIAAIMLAIVAMRKLSVEDSTQIERGGASKHVAAICILFNVVAIAVVVVSSVVAIAL